MSGRRVKEKRLYLLAGLYFVFCLSLSGCNTKETEMNSSAMISDSKKDSGVEENIITLSDGSIVYPDGSMQLAVGAVSYGLYDSFGNLIQSGDTLSVEDSLITGTVSLQQNMPDKKIEYSLMVLIDYVQQYFIVEGQTYLNYLFNLNDDSQIGIDIKLSLPENAKVLTYIIVYEPNITDLTFDTAEGRNELFGTSTFQTISCYLNDYKYDESDFEFSNDLLISDKNITPLFMTEDMEAMYPMPTCRSNDNVKILTGNSTDQEKTYIMLAFLNWEQWNFEEDLFEMFELKANEGYYYNLTVPDVKKSSTFQVFLLENPFHPNMDDWSFGTLRTIINPN